MATCNKPETLLTLDRSIIVLDDSQPSFVQYGVQEVAEYLTEINGRTVPVQDAPSRSSDIQIVVGAQRVRQLAPAVWNAVAKNLGAEGFFIKTQIRGNQRRILVAGATPQGTKYGLVELLKRIRITGRSAGVTSLDYTSQPAFAVRGIHLNGWAFNYPYTFRCWTEADWRSYIDMLTYQGVNLFFIWPFMEIMPVPLSAEDEAYLQEVRRVVDYAQRQRGLEVWIFQSANRVAVNDCGMRDPRRRHYWVTRKQGDFSTAGQKDMNPGDPRQFAKIMRTREALYRIVNNADGYCTIDSDPGGWHESQLRDFMKIFKASRTLLDRISTHGRRTKLVNWLWFGWGHPGSGQKDWNQYKLQEHMRQTIRAMKTSLPEPWWLIAGMERYLSSCAAEGVLGKTVYLPYGTIEGEPARPATQLNFNRVQEQPGFAAVLNYPGTAGVMGNVQTALLQLPHVARFLGLAWHAKTWGSPYAESAPYTTMFELAGHVYPDHQDLLADAWTAIEAMQRTDMGCLIGQLESLIKQDRLGRPGIIGRKLFPDHRQVARDLLWQLKVRMTLAELHHVVFSAANPTVCAKALERFLDAALAWDQQHGWSAYWQKLGMAWNILPTTEPIYAPIIHKLKHMSDRCAVRGGTPTAWLKPITRQLARKYPPKLVTTCAIKPLQQALQQAP